MIKLLKFILLILLVVSHQSFANPSEGRKLFVEKRCVTCHVIGRGKFVGPDLWKVGNKYSKQDLIQWISNTDKLYEKYESRPINKGYPPMPNMNLSTSETLRIIDYIDSLKNKIKPNSSVLLEGRVRNFSDDSKEEYEIKLESVMAEKIISEKNVKTKDGYFKLKDLKGNIAYRVKILHDGIEYSTDKFYYMPEENIKDVNLTVYNSTQEKEVVEIKSSHMVISYDEANNNLLFAEIYNINNISKNIYVGYNSLIEDQRKVLRFSKYKDIEDLSFPHRSLETFIVSDDSIIETIPLPPGERRVVFTYSKKLNFLGANLTKNFYNNIDSLTIIVPENKINMSIEGLEFTKSKSDIKELSDQSYVTYSIDFIKIGDEINLEFNKDFQSLISQRSFITIIFILVVTLILIYLYKKKLLRIK